MFWTVTVASLLFSVLALNAVVIVTRAIEDYSLISRSKSDNSHNGGTERQRGLKPGGTK
jgi:hypothetical protein